MSAYFKDCPGCRYTAHSKDRCYECGGQGSVSKVPPVGSTVVVYDELGGYWQEQVDSGAMKLEDVVLMPRPMIVTDSERYRSGGMPKSTVRVSGWRLARSSRPSKPEALAKKDARWVEGLGYVIPVNQAPAMSYVENIHGPKREPGCWYWVGDPE